MSLREQLRRLATLPPNSFPFTSIYLNLTPQGPGILTHPVFLKKRLSEELRRFPERSPERRSLESIIDRVHRYLDYDLPPTARSVAIFARSSNGAELFEALPLPIEYPGHTIVVSRTPYIYPLVRLAHLFPLAVAVVADTNTARFATISMNQIQMRRELHNMNVHRPQSGGWSHERYRRHAEDHYLHHAKETAALLDRLVRESSATYVLVGGDEVILPELRLQLSRYVSNRMLGSYHWDIRIPEHQLLREVTAAVKQAELTKSRERVHTVLEAAKANGQATLGPVSTVAALLAGKVDELVVSEHPTTGESARVCLSCNAMSIDRQLQSCPRCGEAKLVDSPLRTELVNRALAQGGQVQVVEATTPLEVVGGVAAALRYR